MITPPAQCRGHKLRLEKSPVSVVERGSVGRVDEVMILLKWSRGTDYQIALAFPMDLDFGIGESKGRVVD